jgi:UV excision repair protein RAD23
MLAMIMAIPEAQRGQAIAGLAAQVGVPAEQLQAMVAAVVASGGGAPGAPLGGMGGGQPTAQGVVQLSPTEAAAIKRIQEMGFSQQQALEAYLACDKNEELAINYLLNSGGFQ